MKTQLVKPTLSDMSRRSGNTVTLSWESTPKLKGGKSNDQQGRITKLSTATVTLGATGQYATRKVDEGEFSSADEVKKRSWGSRIGNTCVIEHKGNEYIEFYVDGQPAVSYFMDDEAINKDEIVGLPASRRDTNVMICTVKAANVKILTEDQSSD